MIRHPGEAVTIQQNAAPSEELIEAVHSELRAHNEGANPVCWGKLDQAEHQARPLNLFAFNPDGTVAGGLFAATQFSWLKISIMAVKRERQREGIGMALLREAETIARSRGCQYGYVDTMDYQAPEFYLKAGYRIAGEAVDWDSHGHKKYWFTKIL